MQERVVPEGGFNLIAATSSALCHVITHVPLVCSLSQLDQKNVFCSHHSLFPSACLWYLSYNNSNGPIQLLVQLFSGAITASAASHGGVVAAGALLWVRGHLPRGESQQPLWVNLDHTNWIIGTGPC